MRRRDFIVMFGGAAALPFVARAQERVRRIGVLMSPAEDDPEGQARAKLLQETLQTLGWGEGRNVRIDYRWAGGDQGRATIYASELIGLGPDVILANSTLALAAVRAKTSSIPVVFVNVGDPVGQGFVPNLSRPGGNITGFTAFEFAMGGKWVEVLKDIAPHLTRVAVLFNPRGAPYAKDFLESMNRAAPSFGVAVIPKPVHDKDAIEQIIAAVAEEPTSGLVVIPDAFANANRKSFISLAAQHRLPAVYAYRFFAIDGGLVSYGHDPTDPFRQAAAYINRIIRGEHPGSLPIQQPTKIELFINLKTAKALGLTVPPTLLARADEVIE